MKICANRRIKNGVNNIIYKVCDIHAHVVPYIDDGAADTHMAMQLLNKAFQQGTRSIVCSSHSWGNLNDYYSRLNELNEQVGKENLNIKLYSGCEANCSVWDIGIIINALKNKVISTINNTQYILVEFDPYEEFGWITYCIEQLRKYDYYPIIAHVERHDHIRGNLQRMQELKNLGCLFQINAYSLENETKNEIKDFARKLLEAKYVSFIGSDAHRTTHRTYMIEDGIRYIYENCDVEYTKDVCYRNAERILNIN